MPSAQQSDRIALRIDDIGASSKLFERYSKRRLLNVGPLRDRRLFGAWGPYREMTVQEWEKVFDLLEKNRAKLTVGITAAWVEKNAALTPFPDKFPESARLLKEGMRQGLLEIANHGLTHCVLGNSRFLPGWFGNNRKAHREFWDWLPEETHYEHLKKSQGILENYFGEPVTTLIPPGNVYSQSTLRAAESLGMKVVNCQNPRTTLQNSPLKIVGNENVVAFHDRELVLFGIEWLETLLEKHRGKHYCFVKEL